LSTVGQENDRPLLGSEQVTIPLTVDLFDTAL